VVLRLVPENLVLQLVGFDVIVDDEALEVFRALVHDLAERLEGGKHTGVIFVDALAVGNVGFAQDEHVVDIGSQVGWDTERVLHRNHEHDFPVTPVHEQQAHHDVFGPLVVVQAVVQYDEGARVNGRLLVRVNFLFHLFQHGFLTFEDVFDNCGIVLVVDEEFRHVFAEKVVPGFCAGNDGADGDVLVVVH